MQFVTILNKTAVSNNVLFAYGFLSRRTVSMSVVKSHAQPPDGAVGREPEKGKKCY